MAAAETEASGPQPALALASIGEPRRFRSPPAAEEEEEEEEEGASLLLLLLLFLLLLLLVLEEARESYAEGAVHALPSNSVEEMEANVERLAAWAAAWTPPAAPGQG